MNRVVLSFFLTTVVFGFSACGRHLGTDGSEIRSIPAPVGLAASLSSGTSIALTWSDLCNSESGFVVERKDPADTDFSEVSRTVSNATSFADAGLSENAPYQYRVRTYVEGMGVSVPSNEVAITTLGAGQGSVVAPSNMMALAAGNSLINLTWKDNAIDEEGFRIERSAGDVQHFAQIAEVDANVEAYSDQSGLSINTAYYYRVRAFSGPVASAYSNTSSATPTESSGSFPTAPDNLSVGAVSGAQIVLNWNDTAGNEQGFIIQRRDPGTSTFEEVGATGANVETYTDIDSFTAGATYTYRVYAYNTSGNSNSAQLDVVIPAASQEEAIAHVHLTVVVEYYGNFLLENRRAKFNHIFTPHPHDAFVGVDGSALSAWDLNPWTETVVNGWTTYESSTRDLNLARFLEGEPNTIENFQVLSRPSCRVYDSYRHIYLNLYGTATLADTNRISFNNSGCGDENDQPFDVTFDYRYMRTVQ